MSYLAIVETEDSHQTSNPPLSTNQNSGQRQNQINHHFSPVPCPYQGWNHYFPNQGLFLLYSLTLKC